LVPRVRFFLPTVLHLVSRGNDGENVLQLFFLLLLCLKLIDAGRDQTNKDKILSSAIYELMFLIAGNEKYGAAAHLPPFAVVIRLAFAGVDKNLVFPGVAMSRCEAAGGHGKHAHAKVLGVVRFADHNPAGDTLYFFAIKSLGGTILVTGDFHNISIDEY
jgi:hypothetical protein